MVSIRILHKNPNEIMEIVRELREQGLMQGKDFDFAYNQTKWDDMIGEIPTHTIFTFYTEKYASFVALKYGH
jgi:hypothetical protein